MGSETAQPEPELRVGDEVISASTDCYVIAEVGHNHQGSLEQAMALFDEAKRCGANAVKLQKRSNRDLYTREYFDRPYEHENSFGRTYGEHREFLEFGADEYGVLRDYARQLGITFFATAFDAPSVEFLAELDVPAYKVASGDIKNLPLLRLVAETGKPVIISTGGATIDDVERAYETVAACNDQIAVLQCTAAYPANWDELDLMVIPRYAERFPESVVGLSSHDNGIAMAVAAYVLGARIIEKHFTLNRAMKGTDHSFSLEPQGLEKMIRDLRRTRIALGDGQKRVHESEASAAVKMGKKLVAARDLAPGEPLTEDDIEWRSPGDGLPPTDLDKFVGRAITEHVPAGTPLALGMLAAQDLAGAAEPGLEFTT
jgi:N-acetylneuraminate synthase/sialic acid synthase